MTPRTGTLVLADLLENRFQTAQQFGLEAIEDVLRRDLEAHNDLVEEMLAELVAVSTDRQRVSGTSIDADLLEADEFSRVPTQRVIPGQTVGFPLRKFQYAVGWTRAFMKKRTPRDIAIQVVAAERAHIRRLRYEIQRAVFVPTNYDFVDRHDSGLTLAVKALINADSSSIPAGPFGEAFDGTTHTHYDGSATLTQSAVEALVNDVVEHGYSGQVRVCFNKANEAAVRALSGFVGYVDPRLSLTEGDPTERATITRTDNRAIGLIAGAEVWIKPWVPANYAFAYDAGTEQKPLVLRNGSDEPDGRGLHIEAQLETFPMYAQYLEAMFGFGVWNRLNGAVLKFDNATYSAPTLVY